MGIHIDYVQRLLKYVKKTTVLRVITNNLEDIM